MKRIPGIAALALILVVTGGAQAPAPSVDQILERYVQALGGRSAIEKVSSRVMRGRFDAAGRDGSGSVEMYVKAPDKSLLVMEVPGYGRVRQGFDGTTGWAGDPERGVRDMNGQELSNARRAATFPQATKLRELYPKMTLKGEEKVGPRDAYLIEADPGDGTLRRLYFDRASGLLLRSTVERDTPSGRAAYDVVMEDYREIDGVRVPFTLRQSIPGLEFTIKLTDIRHNVQIDDEKFKKPDEPEPPAIPAVV